MFSLEDVNFYARDGTRIEIEFSTGTAQSSDGTFADPELIARPTRVAGGLYRYLGWPTGSPRRRAPTTGSWGASTVSLPSQTAT